MTSAKDLSGKKSPQICHILRGKKGQDWNLQFLALLNMGWILCTPKTKVVSSSSFLQVIGEEELWHMSLYKGAFPCTRMSRWHVIGQMYVSCIRFVKFVVRKKWFFEGKISPTSEFLFFFNGKNKPTFGFSSLQISELLLISIFSY